MKSYLSCFHTYYKKQTLWILLISLCATIYFLRVFGLSLLNPQNIDWLMSGDPAQHYLGWKFFRHEPWTLPLGKITLYGAPLGSSVVYTDSIPLVAIFLKLFEGFLSADFQYSGVWILSCMILQGITAFFIFKKLNHTHIFSFVGSLFLIVSPIMLDRGHGHYTLMAHWLILVAFLLFIQRSFPWKGWISLIILSFLIHSYLAFMVLSLFLGHFVFLAPKTLKSFLKLSSLFVILPIILYLSGYFGVSSFSSGGYGDYSFNLNGLFNSQGKSEFLKSLPYLIPQYEGFGYLGLGIIILFFLCFFIPKSFKYPEIILGFCCLLLGIFSLSNQVTFNEYKFHFAPFEIFNWTRVGPIFRSSGRMIWPLFYFINIYSLHFCMKHFNGLKSLGVMSFLFFIHYKDLRGVRVPLYQKYHSDSIYQKKYDLLKWEKLLKDKEAITVFPSVNFEDAWLHLGFVAAYLHKKINIAYRARDNLDKTEEKALLHEVQNHQFQKNHLYVFLNNAEKLYPINIMNLPLHYIDGYRIYIP